MAICTIEKANVAINRLAQEGRIGERGRRAKCAGSTFEAAR